MCQETAYGCNNDSEKHERYPIREDKIAKRRDLPSQKHKVDDPVHQVQCQFLGIHLGTILIRIQKRQPKVANLPTVHNGKGR